MDCCTLAVCELSGLLGLFIENYKPLILMLIILLIKNENYLHRTGRIPRDEKCRYSAILVIMICSSLE